MHSVPEEPTAPSVPEVTEEALVTGVREGDVDAALVLWRQHSESARAWAGRHVEGPDESDHLVRRAFARVLREIAAEVDPSVPFRLYLCLTVEDEAGVLPGERTRDHPLIHAFQRLRRSYQLLLWHTAVEPLPAAMIATLLDREQADLLAASSHAVGLLRSEWVAETVTDLSIADSCVWLLLRVDAYAAGTLGVLSAQRYERHLRRCSWCRSTVDDVGEPLEVLRRLVLGAGLEGEARPAVSPESDAHRSRRPAH